jgi:hypothetical protein
MATKIFSELAGNRELAPINHLPSRHSGRTGLSMVLEGSCIASHTDGNSQYRINFASEGVRVVDSGESSSEMYGRIKQAMEGRKVSPKKGQGGDGDAES